MIHWTMLLCALIALPAFGQTKPALVFDVGVCTHFSQRKGILDENLRQIVAAGATSIRDEVPWSQVEREPGQFAIPERHEQFVQAANRLGLKVMLVLGYGNPHYEAGGKPKEQATIDAYVKYCQFVVSHFKGRVSHYEVWNEYNIGIGTAKAEPGTPENYLRLLEPAAKAIRAADPAAKVVGGVTAPQGLRPGGWFDRACELGMVQHCDAVSIHPYVHLGVGEARTPEAAMRATRRLNETVQKHANGRTVPMLITEIGWPTSVGAGAAPPPMVGDFLARTFLLMRTLPNVQGLWWYDFQDDGWNAADGEDMLGMVRPDLTPKPAFFTFQSIAPLVRHATFEAREPAGDDAVWLLRFRQPDGRRVLVAWSTLDQPSGVQLLLSAPADAPPATLTLAGRAGVELRWIYRDWTARPPATQPIRGVMSITATGTPLLLDLGATNATVENVVRRTPIPATQPTTAPAAP